MNAVSRTQQEVQERTRELALSLNPTTSSNIDNIVNYAMNRTKAKGIEKEVVKFTAPQIPVIALVGIGGGQLNGLRI